MSTQRVFQRINNIQSLPFLWQSGRRWESDEAFYPCVKCAYIVYSGEYKYGKQRGGRHRARFDMFWPVFLIYETNRVLKYAICLGSDTTRPQRVRDKLALLLWQRQLSLQRQSHVVHPRKQNKRQSFTIDSGGSRKNSEILQNNSTDV